MSGTREGRFSSSGPSVRPTERDTRPPANAERQVVSRQGSTDAGECRIRVFARGSGTDGEVGKTGVRRVQRELASARREGSNRALEWSHSDQIAVIDVAEITLAQRDERLSAARRGHELDLEPVRLVDLDDGAQITAPKTSIRKVSLKNDGVEELEGHGYAGNAVTNRGTSSPVRTIHTEVIWAVRPSGEVSVARTANFCPNGPSSVGVASADWATRARSARSTSHRSAV